MVDRRGGKSSNKEVEWRPWLGGTQGGGSLKKGSFPVQQYINPKGCVALLT